MTIKINKCGAVALADAVVVIKDGGGVIVASGVTGFSGTVPLTIPAAGSYTVQATDSTGNVTGSGTFSMVANGTYTVVVAVNPPNDRFLLNYLSCGSPSASRMILTYSDATAAGYISPYYYYTPTGGTPTVTITDPQGKFITKVVTGAQDCAVQTTGVIMQTAPGWTCTCFVDDGVGRETVLVETPAGPYVSNAPIASGIITTTMTEQNTLTGVTDANDCGPRPVPSFGAGTIAIGWSWNACSNPPTATQTLWYSKYTWNTGCPQGPGNAAEHWYRQPTTTGTSYSFNADSYSINSTTSPASLTFTWGTGGGGDIAPVAGSITITEIM